MLEIRRAQVRSRPERLFVCRHQDRQRPTSAPRHRLTRAHIERIDIGTLLTVNFYRDKMLVEYVCDLLRLEALVRHHVAPMARRIADAQKNGLVLLACASECFLAPREPVYGIVRVLSKIRACFMYQSVCFRHTITSFVVLPMRSANNRVGRNLFA